MSGKNHEWVDGRLLQTNKRFSQLKQTQKLKIDGWLYNEYSRVYDQIGKPPDARRNDEILDAAYEKIQEADIWIPFGEVRQYFYGRKSAFRRRYAKRQNKAE
jgi:8-oxo-dGTP diphosphatase